MQFKKGGIMADFNQIILSGRLTGDAEVRMTKSGKKLTIFSLAVNDDYKAGEEWVKRAYFFSVLFGGEKKLFKGDVVVIEGKMTQEKFEKEGQAKTYYKVIASKVVPFDRTKKEQKPNSEYVVDDETSDLTVPF